MGNRSYSLVVALAFLAASPVARAAGCGTGGLDTLLGAFFGSGKQNPSNINMTCSSPAYPDKGAGCKQCKKAVDKWKQKLPEAAKKASDADSALSCAGGTSVGKDPGGVDSNLTAFQSQKAAADAAKSSDTSRAANATDASKDFKSCVSEIELACSGKSLTGADKSAAESMQKACTEAGAGSTKFAADKAKDSMGLGDLSKLMTAAAGALGPLAQMMQQQQAQDQTSPSQLSGLDSGLGGTSPTGSSSNNGGGPGSETSKTGGSSKDAVNSAVIGFGTPGSTAGATVGSGNPNGNGAVASNGSEPSKNSFGSGAGSSPGGNGASTGTGGSSGGGTGGALGSAGASKPLAAESGAAPGGGSSGDSGGGFEMNMSGGFKPIVGLKPGKGDAADVVEGVVPPNDNGAKLDALGNRDPAAENAVADDVLAHDDESIFLRVRQKYSLLKGAGRI